MNKNAVIFHGTGANPNVCWYPWLGKQLVAKGFIVEIPHYPTVNAEPIVEFLPKVLANHVFDENTVLVGHSGGAPVILSILENIDVVIKQAILVAGYSKLPNNSEEPVLQSSYDWAKIKSHVEDIYFINSTNDPYGCDDKQGRAMFDQLGGKLIIMDEGHFGAPGQDYPTFDLLDRLIV